MIFYGYLSFDGQMHNIICEECKNTIEDQRDVIGYYALPDLVGECLICRRRVIDIINPNYDSEKTTNTQ